MKQLKKFIKKYFKSFAFYFSYLRYKIFLSIAISLAVGVLDGLGLTMFLPLLGMVSKSEGTEEGSLGKLQFIYDFFQKAGIEVTLLSVLSVMVLFFLLKGGFKFLDGVYRTNLRQLFIGGVRKRMLRAFNKIKFKYFVTTDVGRIQNTMTGEVERVSRSFQFYFNTVEQFILVLVYMVFAFFIDAKFALLVSVGGILTNFLYQLIYKLTKKKSKEFTKDSHSYQGQIIQHISNFKYLQATALTGGFSKKLRDNIDAIERSRQKIGIYNAIVTAAREPMLIVVVAAVIIIQVNVWESALGPILLSLLFFYRALTSLMTMQNSWNQYLGASGSVDNVIDFQNEIRRNKEQNGKEKLPSFTDKIVIEKGDFAYEEEPILTDINLSIAKNEAVAFVGESGSGKTTLTNVIAGLLPLDKGEMYIDGHPIHSLDITSYQKRIGYITQEPVIFNDTIYNNVTFWDVFTDEKYNRFQTALKRASILSFIEQLPKKHETYLGNNGINLSGGQKQRISIARELYKEGMDIIIMDEATSALDTETEKSIQDSIDQLRGEYTLLMVAHRLSTIKNADRIVLMKNGRIDMIGSYTELIRENKNFERMVMLQEL